MWASSKFYESGMIWLSSNANKILVNTTQVATCASGLADAIAKSSSGGAIMTSTMFTMSTGDASGYKLAIDAFSNLPVPTSGTATHITLVATSSSELMYITTCNSKALTTADTVTIPTWDIEIADPTS